MPNRGLFITFEGTDGSGKSTQIGMLVEKLHAEGYKVTENREPGGTPVGQQVRRILLDPDNSDITPMTELLLMFASRAQAATERILPALARGEIVVSDRFTDSSLAYQGEGRGLGFDLVLAMHRIALGELYPHLTICVDVDLETSLARARDRNRQAGSPSDRSEARLDDQSFDFHARVRDAYRRIARYQPQRFRMVDGRDDIVTVSKRVWAEVHPKLPEPASTKG
jgi:dTMP kinase